MYYDVRQADSEATGSYIDLVCKRQSHLRYRDFKKYEYLVFEHYWWGFFKFGDSTVVKQIWSEQDILQKTLTTSKTVHFKVWTSLELN